MSYGLSSVVGYCVGVVKTAEPSGRREEAGAEAAISRSSLIDNSVCLDVEA